MPKHIFVTGGVASSLGKGLTASSLGRLLQSAWPEGHDAEARPVHQRRPGHDESVRARRGVRHRRRRRDRPRSRSLRAVHRRAAHPQLQRHHRQHLPGGARRRAPGRLPGQDRAGHPAHHRRDQAAHQARVHRRRRRGDHRGGRHRRRHRDPAVPRGAAPDAQRRRVATTSATSTSRWCRSSARRASRRPSPRSTPSPSCAAAASSPTSSCAAARRRSATTSSARSATSATSTRTRWSTPPTRATSTSCRSSSTTKASTPWSATCCASTRPSTCSRGRTWSTRSRPPRKPVKIGLIGKYVDYQDAYLSVVESLKHAGFHHGAKVEIDWIQAEDVEGLLATARLADLDGMVIPGGFGDRGFEGKIAAAGFARENDIPCLGICLGLQAMTIDFARNVMGLTGANSTEMDPNTAHPVIDLMHDQRDVSDKGGTQRLGAYYAILEPGSRAHHGVRRAGGERAPPPPVGAQRHVEAAPGGRRPALQRALARPPAGGVHRARRSPVLGGHAGAPRVQEPARSPAPAVPRAGRGRAGAARGALAGARAPRRRWPDAVVERRAFRHLGDRLVHQGYIWHVAVAEFEAPDGESVHPRHRPLARRRGRRAAAHRDRRHAVRHAGAPVPAAVRRLVLEIPRHARRRRRAHGAHRGARDWSRRSGCSPAGSSTSSTSTPRRA